MLIARASITADGQADRGMRMRSQTATSEKNIAYRSRLASHELEEKPIRRREPETNDCEELPDGHAPPSFERPLIVADLHRELGAEQHGGRRQNDDDHHVRDVGGVLAQEGVRPAEHERERRPGHVEAREGFGRPVESNAEIGAQAERHELPPCAAAPRDEGRQHIEERPHPDDHAEPHHGAHLLAIQS